METSCLRLEEIGDLARDETDHGDDYCTTLNTTAQAKSPRRIQAAGAVSDKKAGQVATHFLPALVPLCRSIVYLLILSIRVVLIRNRFNHITSLYIEDLALVDMW